MKTEKAHPSGHWFMAWEYVEPTTHPRTGEVTKPGFWRCSKATNGGRKSCEDWVKMPLTDKGYTRRSAIVEVSWDRYNKLRDLGAISDEYFPLVVLRHDLTGMELQDA